MIGLGAGLGAITSRTQGGQPVMTFDPESLSARLFISSGNRTANKRGETNGYGVARSNVPMPDGGYVEIYVVSGSQAPYITVGLVTAAANPDAYIGSDAQGWGYYQETGTKFHNAVVAGYGHSWGFSGATIGIAYKDGKLYFSRQGVWQGGSNPAAGTGPAFSGLSGTLYVAATPYRGDSPNHVISLRPSAATQVYAPPAGFFAPSV